MGTRTGSHQLSSGLMVSGRPERQPKERPPRMASRTVIYTGGDVKTSGELGRMYGVDISGGENPPKIPPRPPGAAAAARSGPIPGALGPKFTNSGPMSKLSSSSFSGPVTPIQPTGLITSDQQATPGSNRRSGQLDASAAGANSFKKANYGSAVTSLGGEARLGVRVSRTAIWVSLVVAVMGLMAAAFLIAAAKKAAVILAVAVAVLVPAAGVVVWNFTYRKKGVLGFLRKFPDTELRNAVDGQYVKVTGVVTCGSLPLETSYQRVPRCVYVSSELHEYRGCGGEKANAKHRLFSWGCRDSETYVADFYISDNKSGERALVKTGYGAKVYPFVKLTLVVNAKEDNDGASPNFLQWLSSRGLSSNNRLMRLKEGYIKEGYTVSVFGVVRRHNNMFMIVPPTEPISTGFRWRCCLFPTYIDGLILVNDENEEVIPV